MKRIIVGLVVAIVILGAVVVNAPAFDVTLGWDQSQGAAGYKIYYGTESKTYPNSVDAKNVTTYKLTGLTCNPCYFAATAYDAAGVESDYSNEVSLVRLSPPANFRITTVLIAQ